MATPYKMKGHTLPGIKQKLSNAEKRANLLRAVPNEEAYNKLSDRDKKGFDAAGKKIGFPQKKVKKSPAAYAQLIAMAAPMVMDAMKKKKEE